MAVHPIIWRTDDLVAAVNHKMHGADFRFLDAEGSDDEWYMTKFGVEQRDVKLTRSTMLWFGDVVVSPLFFAMKGGCATAESTLLFPLQNVFCFAAVMSTGGLQQQWYRFAMFDIANVTGMADAEQCSAALQEAAAAAAKTFRQLWSQKVEVTENTMTLNDASFLKDARKEAARLLGKPEPGVLQQGSLVTAFI